MNRLYRLLRVVFIPEVESVSDSTTCIQTIEKALHKGFSVCLFINHEDIHGGIAKLNASPVFQGLMKKTPAKLYSARP